MSAGRNDLPVQRVDFVGGLGERGGRFLDEVLAAIAESYQVSNGP